MPTSTAFAWCSKLRCLAQDPSGGLSRGRPAGLQLGREEVALVEPMDLNLWSGEVRRILRLGRSSRERHFGHTGHLATEERRERDVVC